MNSGSFEEVGIQKDFTKRATSSSSRENRDAAKGESMKGFGHLQSKRDSSMGRDENLHKRGKMPSTEGHPVDRSGESFLASHLSDVLVIEIFAGSARLTSAIRDAGMAGVAVDHDKSRSTGPHIALYDLNDRSQFDALVDFIRMERHRIIWVHFAPSCGTASRARERPLKSWEQKGFKIPKPLRSDEFPLGVPGLQGIDKQRTETANITYSRTAELAKMLNQWDITVSIENPLNSIFWLVPDIVSLLSQVSGFETVFDHCCHGGMRDKSTMWWSNKNWFLPLAQRCDGSHTHAKWNPQLIDGKLSFPTHQEASYPILLCQRLASIIKEQAMMMGVQPIEDLQQQLEATSSSGHRFILGMLPRGKKFKPLVSEYGAYQKHVFLADQQTLHDELMKGLPKGSKIMHRLLRRGVLRDNAIISEDGTNYIRDDNKMVDANFTKVHCAMDGCCRDFEVLTVGIPREPMDFVARAFEAGHPRSMSIHLSDFVQEMLRENFEHSPLTLLKKRAAFFWKWTARAKELSEAELTYKSSLPSYLQVLHKKKKLLLWSEILQSLDYPDKSLLKQIAEGFPISGWLPESHVFPKETRRPEYDVETVKRMASGLNKAILQQTLNQDRDEAVTATWNSTLEELDKGWVFLDDESGLDSVLLARRFGLRQRDKIRVIDDCTIGGFNRTTGSREKLKLHSIDEMAAYVSWTMSNVAGFSTNDWVGKTYDLTSAYKQFGVSVADRNLLRILTLNPEHGRSVLLGTNSLPFGATGSVNAFLRVSLAIWFIGVRALGLCWTAFFDDYTLLSRKCLAKSAGASAELLFDLLGIEFAREGKKCTEFSTLVSTLGVELNLCGPSGEVLLGHTEKRKTELSEAVSDIILRGKIETKFAESLRGRMQWFEGYVFGRTAQRCVQTVGELSLRSSRSSVLTGYELQCFKDLQERVLRAPPIEITSKVLDTWIIFTDGACEGSDTKVGSIGGVLVDPHGNLVEFFSSEVPSALMTKLCETSANPIYELELLPVLVAYLCWRRYLVNSQTVFYLDNDAARAGLTKALGATQHAEAIVHQIMSLESQFRNKPWYGRVPTASNISDDPSRLECQYLESLGCQRCDIDWASQQMQVI